VTDRDDAGSRTIELARQEANAALSILLDPASSASSAESHIVDSWRLLFEGASSVEPPADADALCAWIRASAAPLSEGARDQAAALVSELAGRQQIAPIQRGAGPGHRRLTKHARDLQRVVDSFEPKLRSPVAIRRVWLGRGAAVLAALAVAAAFVVVIRDKADLGTGPWRGDYYPTHTFEGAPILRRDADIDFSWGRKPPLERISADLFSMRWDTCMVLREATQVHFLLTSDDGSKLFLDGETVIDLWEAKGKAKLDKAVELEAGVHHLRLDYFERRGSAQVVLQASVDGEKPGPIPRGLLYYPGDNLNAEDPCHAVKGGQPNR